MDELLASFRETVSVMREHESSRSSGGEGRASAAALPEEIRA